MRHQKREPAGRRIATWSTTLAVAMIAAVACGAATADDNRTKGGSGKDPSCDPRDSLAPLVEKVAPAVVNIRTTRRMPGMPGFMGRDLFEFFFGPRFRGSPQRSRPQPRTRPELRAVGSGFVIEKDGVVVTNHHVVEGTDEIEVQLADDRSFDAELIGSDERTDIALLQLRDVGKDEELPALSFGDSDELRVGDRVVAIGNPFGLDHTVTSGIVSAKERVIGAGPYDDFIQTDASINPGNSGGPLFDLRGNVVGINTAINPQGQGIGFAIPSNLARGLIESLLEEGRVVRGWLGIVFQPLDPELSEAFGVDREHGAVVAEVTPGSPADEGGMRRGDVIVAVDGEELRSGRRLPAIVAGLAPGTTVEVTVIREGDARELEIEIGEMPEALSGSARRGGGGGEGGAESELGVRVEELDGDLRGRLDAEKVEHGVVVIAIDRDSPAAGVLRKGDIIAEVDRNPVRDPAELARATDGLKSGDDLLLLVYRRGSWMYVVVRV
jgi:serine protease Do